MMTFLSILFILIGINAVMMVFSLSAFDQEAKKNSSSVSEESNAKIYPLDLITSEYKKAV